MSEKQNEIVTAVWPCEACGGQGYQVIAGCCGNANPDGSCCGNAVPVQDGCPHCNAGGWIGEQMTREEAEKNGYHIVDDK